MTKNEFKNFTAGRMIFLDGSTGINLYKAGMPKGVCPEQWILEHPDVISTLQRAYIDAGSDIIFAPTFTGNRIKLAEYSLQSRIKEINFNLAKLSVKNAAGQALVAGNLTMTGQLLKPLGEMDFEELIDIYKEQIKYLADGGVDLIGIETMMSLAETRAALIAAAEVCDLPVMVSMTFEADGRTLYGSTPQAVAIVAESLGAAAVGVNCAFGPDRLEGIIREMAAVSDLPIIAKPNAGIPKLNADGDTVFDMDEPVFTGHMLKLIEAGASIIGGCCGTNPEYIRALKSKYSQMTPLKRQMTDKRHLSSERRSISFGLDGPFIIVGERINPTGKKKLKEELREGKLDMVCAFAEEQEAEGALILDVNMGMEAIDECEMMLRAVAEISAVSSLPLAIDSSRPDVIEAALRNYPGRALINSVSLEKAKFNEILKLAKKYGAMFILLPLSDAGLPADITEKIAIIEKISVRALELGIAKKDIIVDALVTTVGANKNAAIEALETIRYCRESGYATICGLSNISFGLPERGFINASFLTMAINAGLTMAIANPSQDLILNNAFACDLLLNHENADMRYIDRMSQYSAKTKAASAISPDMMPSAGQVPAKVSHHGSSAAGESSQQSLGQPDNIPPSLMPIYHAVLKGRRSKITGLAQEALDAGTTAAEILNQCLLPAIGEVGELFDRGIYFLPQLIAGAETMKLAIEYIEPLLGQSDTYAPKATVIIATVAGDIHDIGKNLVVLMLRNHGFNVIDLGKDVAAAEIIAKAKEFKADIIALSALMTTTMAEMKNVINLAKENRIKAKIIIGGAVITAEYAAQIGASGYAKDAAEAVRLVHELCPI